MSKGRPPCIGAREAAARAVGSIPTAFAHRICFILMRRPFRDDTGYILYHQDMTGKCPITFL